MIFAKGQMSLLDSLVLMWYNVLNAKSILWFIHIYHNRLCKIYYKQNQPEIKTLMVGYEREIANMQLSDTKGQHKLLYKRKKKE